MSGQLAGILANVIDVVWNSTVVGIAYAQIYCPDFSQPLANSSYGLI